MNLRTLRSVLAAGALGVVAVGGMRACVLPEATKEWAVTPLAPWRQGMSLRETYETAPATNGRARLRLLVENEEAWAARWELLARSRRSIDLSYFILHQDAFGLSLLGHLFERAKAGVRIRLLLDAHGTKMSWTPQGNDLLDELLATGNVEIKMYRPLHHRFLEALLKLAPTAAVASEHDKILVIDGRRSLIGGRNIGAEYFRSAESEGAYHDTDLVIGGAAAADKLTRAFEAQFESARSDSQWREVVNVQSRELQLRGAYRAMDDWLRGKTSRKDGELPVEATLAELEKIPTLKGVLRKGASSGLLAAETRIVDSQTRFGSSDDPITQLIARLVQSAERSILVESPYLVLSEEGVRLLEGAAARGVEIAILTNSPVSSDNALSQAFFLEQWPELLARVPTLRLYVGGEKHTLHAKTAVFDGTLSLVGTYNLDPTSMTMNSEVVAAIWSADFAEQAAKGPRRAIAGGPPTVHEYRIRKIADGKPVRSDDGRPVIEFGPEQHCTPEQWKALAVYWNLLRAAEKVPGFSAIL